MPVSPAERELGIFLRDLPREYNHRYTEEAENKVRETLFRSLAGNDNHTLRLLFPSGPPPTGQPWRLRDAQGAVDGAEYTAAAKGHPCGHIFKAGESTYHCKTCAADDTCVLCAKCFTESDHEGHMVYISVSPGNSGCCDCADDEAWVRPVHCSIHSADTDPATQDKGKTSQPSALPDELLELVRMTIGKAFDYLCDVFSCSPEQLRLSKTEESVKSDELLSRLTSDRYGGPEVMESDEEYALILWNDEKHTVTDVRDQVAKACKQRKTFGFEKAMEVNDTGRSIIHYSKDIKELLAMAAIIEQLKVSVTVRSARDTFREQMCGTVVDWISDISGCSYASDPHILRNTVCQQLLQPWRMGSEATNESVGQKGIDDHEHEDNVRERRANARWFRPMAGINIVRVDIEPDDDGADDDEDDDDDEGDDEDGEEAFILEEELDEAMDDGDEQEAMEVDDDQGHFVVLPENDLDLEMDTEGPGEIFEATHAGYPPPPAPPGGRTRRTRAATNEESDESEAQQSTQSVAPFSNLPKTPKHKVRPPRPPRPAKYWLEVPDEYKSRSANSPEEDLWQRVRLDYLILYDLRLWKTLRIDLRHLYISTVVTVPQFKRILGLRFAGLYTMLAQLYLIADREPDHSIINLSVQMLTTPSITAEVVERGNFLTNLMAILYTFLTTRQVGFPSDVNPTATLAFDQGAVTNRRMFHFFIDTRYMFQSAFVQEKVRTEQRYLLQFLDLVKLHQGICPNVRAVGEHVEYEADAWISASMIIKEVNRLCRQVAESFKTVEHSDFAPIQRAIRHTAQATFINAIGTERSRFTGAETKHAEKFHCFHHARTLKVDPEVDRSQFAHVYPTSDAIQGGRDYSIPSFEVANGAMSFHHPLHYLLSWLLEAGKSMTRTEMLRVLHFDQADQRDPWTPNWKPAPSNGPFKPDEVVSMLFEHPLRVCTWLAQMRAGMWVRNGITLRHQMHTYRGTSQRDVSFQRDILLLQAGLVLCGSEEEPLGVRFLAQIIDRFNLNDWVCGVYDPPEEYDEQQRLDVVEEFYHLLIVLLSERQNLIPGADNADSHVKAIQRDIAHVLCFKPLSFSDISARLTDRVADSEEFDSILEDMTTFRSPEGLNDSGTFELHPEFIELVDPYYAYYNRNQREESESIHRQHIAKLTGKAAADVVYEPRLPAITSGLFRDLSAFTQSPLFEDVVFFGLAFPLKILEKDPQCSFFTKLEGLTHVILHLTLIAVMEDKGPIDSAETQESFIRLAIGTSALTPSPGTIFELLYKYLATQEFASCAPKIRLILDKMSQKWPEAFADAVAVVRPSGRPVADPASSGNEDAKALKKKQALERQAKVMASFKAQQNSFMANQGLDIEDEDFSDMDEDAEQSTHTAPEERAWEFPTGSCMLCQEETDDKRLYGTFAFIGPSRILRQTPVNDEDFVKEVLETPPSLDRSAEDIRPFGVAKGAEETFQKINADGSVSVQKRQGLSKGFPKSENIEGPVVTSCGHLMHYNCFETYMVATERRHATQIARNHPERADSKEFLCPLCKALGNTFLPILWKDKRFGFPGALAKVDQTIDYDNWLKHTGPHELLETAQLPLVFNSWRQGHLDYLQTALNPTLATTLPQLRQSSPAPAEASGTDYMSDDFPPPEPTPLERSRSALPELVQRAAIELGLVSRPTNSEPQSPPPAEELRHAFTRIETSMRPNKVISSESTYLEPGTQSSSVQTSEALANALAFTISSVEIAHRGVAPADGIVNTTVLDAVPEQTMTTLKILSETLTSITAQAATRPLPIAGADSRVHRSWYSQLGHLLGQSVLDSTLFSSHSLLENDLFIFFATCTVNELPMGDDMHHVLRLCFSAEVIKVLLVFFGRQSLGGQKLDPATKRWEHPIDEPVSYFQQWITSNHEWLTSHKEDGSGFPCATALRLATRNDYHDEIDIADGTPWPELLLQGDMAAALETLIDRYALVFLRKVLILLHVRFGIDFSLSDEFIDPNTTELARLARLLRLPQPSEIFQQLGSATASGEALRRLACKWALAASSSLPFHVLRPKAQSLSHPSIFELVGLPKNYDTLTEEAIKRRCPTTGKEITDPAICLFCSEIFCSQAGCCMRDRSKGGCYQHRAKCGGAIGVFISIRKCMVLFLHNSHGSWFHAPYLDRHGEVDPTLRRHHQLFLNQKRYDRLIREAWLSGGVQSVISRRLEGDMNTGGWETL
ncbi:hypothetical protein AAFC00_001172 [Neodothiora populina]|uniref:E3 ubiquitin-protein ligase n=1 Tax=Neodothiora populina TaxID=2781224 RepID=A0ABR3PN24_9PEZI